MISVIICSVNPTLASKVVDAISQRIGTTYECIVFDNRKYNWGICRVYNHCARKAKGKYICFIHEDVLIKTDKWGEKLIALYEKVNNCGVIGCLGALYVPRNTYSYFSPTHTYFNQYMPYKNCWGKVEKGKFVLARNTPENRPYYEANMIEGKLLFCSTKVYEDVRFDEDSFRDFHLYDIDFSVSAAEKGYKNIVCATLEIFHNSLGNNNSSYARNIEIFREKHTKKLPLGFDGLSTNKQHDIELYHIKNNIFLWRKLGCSFSYIKRELSKYNSNSEVCYALILYVPYAITENIRPLLRPLKRLIRRQIVVSNNFFITE